MREAEGRESEEVAAQSEKEKNRGGELKGSRTDEREREEEEGARPQPVPRLGDEAFWTGSHVGSALYVLKRDVFIRISVGGSGDLASKFEKSKTLAQVALRRL